MIENTIFLVMGPEFDKFLLLWPQQKNPKSLFFLGFRVHFWALVFELHVLCSGLHLLEKRRSGFVSLFPILDVALLLHEREGKEEGIFI